ncbi:hypothetical protein KBX35_12995 [Micromonospora sp. C32]|uniref:DUF3592 domain-containing protein n=1 Tax=unclassified Micromonospora TaxID=2617518 RepID=UPI001B39B3C7|nr:MULTISPECIES: DUF3592 domain-containing protein [unclassified Micromonospora]MBQ1044609.1 hypothetical protein [Micromonospora sp. C72]MBQ1055699.1 hypothetical protein [Micromonospora sp. C32]
MESPFGWRELKLVVVVILGTLLVGGGMLLTVRLNEAIDERVRVGAETTGQVVHVERFKISRSFAATRLTVDYTFEGVRYRERFSSELDESGFRVGELLDVRVDTTDPTRAATPDGYATEDLLLQAPTVLEVFGALMIVISLALIRTGPRRD